MHTKQESLTKKNFSTWTNLNRNTETRQIFKWSEKEQEDFLNQAFPDIKPIKIQKRHEVFNIPCAFDTESTSFYKDDVKQACVYAWMFGMNGAVIMGRDLTEFETFVQFLSRSLELQANKRHLIVYVHNLAWDFQFLLHRFKWENVFALDSRKPCYAVTDSGIEFRCSYILSGMSLAELGEHLRKYSIQKMVGDLDYSLKRHSGTPLTKKEIGYCVNDVLVVMAYIQEKIETDGDIRRIQLTKTGYVRKACRDACLYENGKHNTNARKGRKYHNLMKSMCLTVDEYLMAKRAFQGGFTHASAFHSGDVCFGVRSMDFTSSYPYVIVSEMFPFSTGEKIKIRTMKSFRKFLRLYCCLFDVEFTHIVAKPNVPDHYISSSKCVGITINDTIDNGRVVMAEHIRTTVTEIDFQLIEQLYTFDDLRIGEFYVYRKNYLPHDFVGAVLDFYESKTTLKGIPEREDDYMRGKEHLNSCYGMMVTEIFREQNTVENGEWITTHEKTIDKTIEIYNNSSKRFLSYLWGVWVTAYARRNLWTGILALGDDYIYADTDSVKYMHPEIHDDYFNKYNRIVMQKLERACKYQKIPIERIKPKTIKGIEKPLGVWDFDGEYSRFKTLGAKRYMTEHDGKISITVSGVNKKKAVPYLTSRFKDPFTAFSDDLVIPAEYTGKQTHTYVDGPCDGVLVDYLGTPGEYHELSFAHLEPCEYHMSLSIAYIDYLLGVKQWTK